MSLLAPYVEAAHARIEGSSSDMRFASKKGSKYFRSIPETAFYQRRGEWAVYKRISKSSPLSCCMARAGGGGQAGLKYQVWKYQAIKVNKGLPQSR